MLLRTTVAGTPVKIDLPGVLQANYKQGELILRQSLGQPGVKNREAICDCFLYMLRNSPRANASDLWHHVVYRLYCDVLGTYRPQDPKQSWVRASGEALEIAVETIYSPVLAPHGVTIRALIGAGAKRQALQDMRLERLVGAGKLDIALYVRARKNQTDIFGGVHVKASLAERVSDDVPCSRALMARGYWSALWTLDVKSFPPPAGDLLNRGELGTPASPSEKRKYVENHGDFDNCYSANDRTTPSTATTPSGKRIYNLRLGAQPDVFARHAVSQARAWRNRLATDPER